MPILDTSSAATTRPFLVALTGGIASGKSAVASLFGKQGVPILDTDQIARDVVEPGAPAFAQILEHFGRAILDASGRIDRRQLREAVFADPDQRQILENITHPAIREELERRAAVAGGPYQVHVIPLLVEGGRSDLYDRVLVVDCPEADQVQRLAARDRATTAQAQQILDAQASRADRLSAADDVIVNTGTLADLEQFVLTLHRNYALLAERADA